MPSERAARYHLMIVGIDEYEQPNVATTLRGCVNDAEQIVNLLCENGVVPSELERALFLAPRPGKKVPWGFRAPTRANLLQRLEEIASAAGPDDHVWIYYSGHGAQREQLYTAAPAIFEALVPVDFGAPGTDLLYDFELGRALARLRTASVTVILDCCNSAGASKSLPGLPGVNDAEADAADRFIWLSQQQLAALPPLGVALADTARGFASQVAAIGSLPTVVAACHSDEKAREHVVMGKRQGIFTAALLAVLASCHKAQLPLAKLRWADIWSDVRRLVQQQNPAQLPWLSGPLDRPVLGGRAAAYDVGISLTAQPTGPDIGFDIGAGQLLGLRAGSLLGVYPADPPLFAPVGSAAEAAQRVMTLQVVQATPWTATARPITGAPLPRGARARLLTADLRVFLAPDVARQLGGALLLTQARACNLELQLTPTADDAELQIVRLPSGSYALGDSANPPTELRAGARPLAVLTPTDNKDELRGALITAMRHYAQYVLPLRMVQLAQHSVGSHDTSQLLEVDLLSCTGLSAAACRELHENRRPRTAMLTPRPGHYQLRAGGRAHDGILPPDLFALWLRSRLPLFVSVLCCSAEGRIEEYLLNEQLPSGPVGRLMWRDGQPGNPFAMQLAQPRSAGIARLIVCATTLRGGHGLESLKQAESLQGTLHKEKSLALSMDRPLDRAAAVSKPPTAWTARTLTIELALGEAPDAARWSGL